MPNPLYCFKCQRYGHHESNKGALVPKQNMMSRSGWSSLDGRTHRCTYKYRNAVVTAISFTIPMGSRVFLLYRIVPLPFSMACHKRRTAAFLVICRIAAGWVVLVPNPIFFSLCKYGLEWESTGF